MFVYDDSVTYCILNLKNAFSCANKCILCYGLYKRIEGGSMWRKTMEYYIGLGGVSYFPIVQTLQELRKTQASKNHQK